VAPAAHPLGNGCHVHLAFATQTEPDAAFRQLAEKNRSLNPGNAYRVVRNPPRRNKRGPYPGA
jgi:hypothetical protein